MNISDELLAAYVDGDLSGAERARVEQAIALDARLAARVAQYRASRSRFRGNSERAWHQPVSQRLLHSAHTAAGPTSAQIIDLARVRAERKRRRERHRVFQPYRIALVASLGGGLLIGALAVRLIGGNTLTRYRNGNLIADGALAYALDHQLAGRSLPGGHVHVQMSFKDKQGAFCRTFSIGPGAVAGLACREGDYWRLVSLLDGGGHAAGAGEASAQVTASPSVAPSATPTTAALSAPRAGETHRAAPLLRAVIKARIAGAPLDAQAEARARGADWR